MSSADRVIRWSTALAARGVAAVTAVASYEHAFGLVRAYGKGGWTARMIPLTVVGAPGKRRPGCRRSRHALGAEDGCMRGAGCCCWLSSSGAIRAR